MAEVKIPEELKAAIPQNWWGKILVATPVVMTVIATMLAGLASSEMTKAQYDRALAAQLQSKAGDQWGYFQAKKLRSAVAANSFALLASTVEFHPLEPASLPDADSLTVAALTKLEIPKTAAVEFSGALQEALEAIEKSPGEQENALKKVSPDALAQALIAAKDAVKAFDDAIKPISRAIDRYEETFLQGDRTVFRDFNAARLRFQSSRYETEARRNQVVATIYELQVRKSNYAAEKHFLRSAKFFYGMLAAQMAVIIATFAIAAHQKNFLWIIAALAGLAAVSFAVYVFLYV